MSYRTEADGQHICGSPKVDFSTLLLTKGIAADQVEQHIAAIKKIWRAANGVPADRVAFVQEYLKRL